MQAVVVSPTRYTSNRWLANLIVVLLGFAVIVGLLAVVSGLMSISLPDAAREQIIKPLQGWLFISTSVFFGFWLYRAHKNLRALGAEALSFSSVFTVGSFFVPVLNLYLPAAAVTEIWKASDPSVPPGQDWRYTSRPGLITAWWLILLASGVAERLLLREQIITELQVPVGRDMFYVVSALLTLFIVRGINHRQELKAQTMQ